jgi:hypothetical protein
MMRISDHALIRFLDRVAGRAHRATERIGAADYTVKADGLVYVVRDGVLVTALGPAMQPQREAGA